MNKQLIIKNEISELSRVNVFLDHIAEKSNIGKELLFDLKLVIEEIISNIIFYAYNVKNEHKIKIDFEIQKKNIRIKIEDDGKEFNPVNVPPPDDLDKPIKERKVGGLGIHFVKTLMDSVEYKRENDRNILVLRKKIS